MAFDLLSGETDATSWSRGEVVIDLMTSRTKKLPWGKIAAGTGVGIGLLAILTSMRKEHRAAPHRKSRPWARDTTELPNETMSQVVFERRR